MLFTGNILQNQVAFRLGDADATDTRSGRVYFDLFEEEDFEEPGNKNYIYYIYL